MTLLQHAKTFPADRFILSMINPDAVYMWVLTWIMSATAWNNTHKYNKQ